MKNLKYIISLGFCLLFASVWAQQDPLYTQYLKNPITINPAITAYMKIPNISLTARTQWSGMEGAPNTAAFSYQSPLSGYNVGIGGNLIHDRIGPVIQTGIYLNYAYHLTLDNEKERELSMGLMGGFNYYSFDLLPLRINETDNLINPSDGINRRFLPNFGVGLFYHSPQFFFGASIPKLLRNSLSEGDNSLTVEDKEERHLFAMTGAIIDLNNDFKFRPSAIGRMVNGAPVSADINATLVYNEEIWIGALYRIGVSWGGMLGWQLNDRTYLAYSYDFNHRLLRGMGFNTHEIMISFNLQVETQRVTSPRYF